MADMEQSEDHGGLTRRDMIKKGALLGGTLMWTTPAIQAVGMRPALAQTPSPTCNVWYAVKIERVGELGDWECFDIFDQTNPNGTGTCLDVEDAPLTVSAGGCGHITVEHVAPEGAADKTWVVRLDPDCQSAAGAQCAIKTGQASCVVGGCQWDPIERTLTFESPNGQDISHVEFTFCCSE